MFLIFSGFWEEIFFFNKNTLAGACYKNIQKSIDHILFLHIRSNLLLRYARQNNGLFVDTSFFVLVTNAVRILLTKNKNMFP